MAGIYIHVPFCSKRCTYCDFFSNTKMQYKEPYLKQVLQELTNRKAYLPNETIETIYFGGGTPSQLNAQELETILEHIYKLYTVSPSAEITMEANPDDLTPAYVKAIASLPFNRLSMGIQSFNDADLKFLNRRHSAKQAIAAVANCQAVGLTNLSIDLMYGLPNQTLEAWRENINQAIALNVPHISAYHLIYEEGTALYKLMEAGKVRSVDEDVSLAMFTTLIDTLSSNGYQHYEISNFAQPHYISKHNSAYWKGKPYLGVGPSAHSYDGVNRAWNIASLTGYIEAMEQQKPALEVEVLDQQAQYNDFILTGLRTMWGINTGEIENIFGEKLALYCKKQATPYIKSGLLCLSENNTLTLSREGIFISDSIMSDLMFV